jgi:EmrB/QacA subfamily drug resistance transporter
MQTTGPKNRWLGLVAICISLLVISLDNTVVNVALPSISKELGASASELQWIVDAYVLVFAALLLTMGSISDRIGRKRALQFGIAWFGVFSLGAALSNSTGMLIAMRALLGIGGAIIMPSTLSLITSGFLDPKERAQAIAIWAAIFGLGVGVGPAIGGWLLEQYNWSAVFYINLPIILIALVAGQFTLDESRDEHAPAPDFPGALLSIGGLFALIYGIIEAGQDGWTADHVLAAFGAAFVLLAVFAWWENRTTNAMLPLRFFKNMSFTGANVALTLVMFSMFGATFFMSQYFQSVQGYSAFETGLRILPMALVIMIAAGASARIARRIGTKLTVSLGILLAGSGLLYMSLVYTVGSSYPTVLVGMALLGLGMGSAMSPATNSIMGSVPVSKAGVGSAMNDTTRMVGGALGVAVLGTIMNHTYLDQVDTLAAKLPPQVPPQVLKAVENSIQGAHIAAANVPIPQAAQMIVETANRAFVSGMTDALLIGAIIMGVASLLALLILPAQVIPAPEEEVAAQSVKGEAPQPALGD